MIEIYAEIAEVIAQLPVIKWVDLAPRIEDHTNIYPAVYISMDSDEPLNVMGGSTLCEFAFTVELWIKPYHASTVKPTMSGLCHLSKDIGVVSCVRKAIFDLEGNWVRGTTLLNETMEKQKDDFYKIVQKWKATTAFSMPPNKKLTYPPKPEFNG